MEGIMGVVLAGGLSKRMGGQDKAFLQFGGQTLLQRTLDRLEPQVDTLRISANGDPARFAALGLPVILDSRADHPGPMAGIESAFLASDASWVLSVPVDLPFLPLDLVERLSEAASIGGARPVMATSLGRVHPVVCLWPRTALPAIRAALDADERRLLDWFATHPHHQVDFSPADPESQPDPFLNLNDPVALERAERWLVASARGEAG
ncbi:MAG: molybdenum cofactor guanylyltransferase MobA [Magnetococcales bacterium]|nr:molybdenum cofactor guanylyltransferase MobA [Magnetococcales bacterium]